MKKVETEFEKTAKVLKRKFAMYRRCATGKPVSCSKCIGCQLPDNNQNWKSFIIEWEIMKRKTQLLDLLQRIKTDPDNAIYLLLLASYTRPDIVAALDELGF